MKFKIGTKIMAGYIVILIFLVVVTFVTYKGMEGMETSYNKITDVNIPTIVSIWEAQYYEQELRGLTRAYLLYSDAKYEKEFYNTDKEFKDQIAELEKLVQTEESKQFITQILKHHNNYVREATTVINYHKSGQMEKAMAHTAVALPYAAAFDETAKEFSAFANQAVGGWVAEAQAKAASTQSNSVIIGVLAAILGIGIGIYLSRSISKPVIILTDLANEAATGNLTITVPEIKTEDEIQELGKSFAIMVTNFRQILGKINEASLQVASTAEELSSSSEQNSSAAQQIAKAIEELAKGNSEQTKIVNDAVNVVEQMTKSIESIAAGAQEQARNVTVTSEQAAEVAEQVQDVARRTEGVKDGSVQNLEAAQKGGLAVNKAIAGMEKIQIAVTDSGNKITELGKQSQQIGEIIQVIDDIAEQTNLLALNAAIEAARAGEHGKGFAVVADEVRKLAERSGKATKEIATLITSIQKGTEIAVKSMEVGTKEVSSGVEIAREAGDALREILVIVEKSSTEVEAIAKAFNNITTSTNEVSKASENVAAITEQNTAATEEMAAGSGQVNSLIINIAAIAEQSAASTEEVSASTEEMNASTEEITATAQSLAKMAQDFQQLLAQFKV